MEVQIFAMMEISTNGDASRRNLPVMEMWRSISLWRCGGYVERGQDHSHTYFFSFI